MPNMYKEKSCKSCGVLHRKRGPYCSISCSNRGRDGYSEKVSENMRKVAQEYNRSPEGIAHNRLAGVNPDDFAIELPDFPDLPEGYDLGERW